MIFNNLIPHFSARRLSVGVLTVAVFLFFAAGILTAQNAVQNGAYPNSALWPLRAGSGKYLGSRFTTRSLALTDGSDYSIGISAAYPIGKSLDLGITSTVDSDRFFTHHYWNLWFGWRFNRSLTIALSGDLAGYGFSPGDATIGDPDDPLANSSQSKFGPSASVGFGLRFGRDLLVSTVVKNLLHPDLSLGETEESREPISLQSGLAWRFGNYMPFIDANILASDRTEMDISGGIAAGFLKDRLSLIVSGGNRFATGGVVYNFGEIAIGYEYEYPLGDAANVYKSSHSAHIELRSFEPERRDIELPDTTDHFCPATPLLADWLIIRKDRAMPAYSVALYTQALDSAVFYVSPGRKYRMTSGESGRLWTAEIQYFPGPTAWIAGFKGDEGYCLKHIYANPVQAARMTVAVDEYIAVVPFAMTDRIADTIANYSVRKMPFYLDSDNPRDWNLYLDWEDGDRFMFAAPGYEPEPPQIRLASEFAVEKVDNRLHAEVVVSIGRLPHRLLATSPWAGDCAVYSDNPHDTLTFIVPNEVPDSIPIVITGSATDPWMRVHRIGPDTLDNTIIAKVWDNTDYSLFNFVYFAENDRNCIDDIDKLLEHLIVRTVDTDGKLLITGYRYRDALCAYDHARTILPATQVRIDPSLIPPGLNFDPRWAAPDSLWFVNNFSQALVFWEEIPQPVDVAGYMVFADKKPIPSVDDYNAIAHLQLNAEPIVGNMFIVSDLQPEKPLYVRIATVTGDGRFGELSKQIKIQTKARRKTTVYEFSSHLGNPSAFDFSEYREVSMRSENASLIDLYLGSDAIDDGYGNLELKSPSIVSSSRTVWQSRNAGILFMDVLPLPAPYDAQEITSIEKMPEEPCRVGGRYLVRTPDGYELVIRVESVEGEFPDRRIDIQYLYRLVEDAPIYHWR